jgi:hypothetical protein
MSLIIVETPVTEPITDEAFQNAEQNLSGCLKARHANWRYSLLANERDRLICTYDALDAASVQQVYHSGGFTTSRAWPGLLIQPEIAPGLPQTPLRVVMEGTQPPLSEEHLEQVQQQMQDCLVTAGITWVCAYLSLDRTRFIWELVAPDLNFVQALQPKLPLPVEQVWLAVVVSPG